MKTVSRRRRIRRRGRRRRQAESLTQNHERDLHTDDASSLIMP